MPLPFASSAALEQGFADGLSAMLENHRSLGVYILALANAAYDDAVWAQLAPALSVRHAVLATAITETLRRGQKLAKPDDDVLVYLKLHAIGFEHLGTMESRRAGPWEFMFNPIRALRPPRISGQTFEGLLRAFDATGFHFNKPLLTKEIPGKANSPASRRVCSTTSSPSPACTACWSPSPCVNGRSRPPNKVILVGN